MKYCENIIVTFNCDFLFFYYYSLLCFPCIHTFLPLFLFFSFFFLLFFPLHTRIPSPLLSSLILFLIFLDFSFSTQSVLCFYFSLFKSLSLSLCFRSLPLILSPCHTHSTGREQSQNLKLASPKTRVPKRGSCVMCSKERRRRNIKNMLCFSGDGSGKHDVLFFFFWEGVVFLCFSEEGVVFLFLLFWVFYFFIFFIFYF